MAHVTLTRPPAETTYMSAPESERRPSIKYHHRVFEDYVLRRPVRYGDGTDLDGTVAQLPKSEFGFSAGCGQYDSRRASTIGNDKNMWAVVSRLFVSISLGSSLARRQVPWLAAIRLLFPLWNDRYPVSIRLSLRRTTA